MRISFVVLLMACSRTQAPADAQPAAVDAGNEAAARSDDDDVKPVYPDAPPNPLATKLCVALHQTEDRRRRECCNVPPRASTAEGIAGECVRNVSAALMLGTIDLASADIDACAAGMERAFAGCDWVGPLPPAAARECQGIVHGKLAAAARCRSTLECGAGLVCHGVGPTTLGRCGPPRSDNAFCGSPTDVLVTYARQDTTDELKPSCATGTCVRGRCAPHVKAGERCESSDQCEPGTFCRSEKCSKVPAKAGEHCSDTARCDTGLACQPTGRCGPERKPAGATCTSDLDCAAACIRKAGAKAGTCGMRCGV